MDHHGPHDLFHEGNAAPSGPGTGEACSMQLLARRLTHGQQDVVPVIVAQPVQRGQPVANRGPDPGQGAWIGRAPTHLPETRGTDVCQLISLRQARRRSYRRARFSTAANPSTCGGVMTRIRPPSPCSVGSLPLQRRGRILDRPRPAPGARALTQLRPFGCGTPSRNALPGGSDHGCSVGRSRRR